MIAMHNRCPDDGTCHHECDAGCFRVECCGPLSGVFPGDEWPEWMTEHGPVFVRGSHVAVFPRGVMYRAPYEAVVVAVTRDVDGDLLYDVRTSPKDGHPGGAARWVHPGLGDRILPRLAWSA